MPCEPQSLNLRMQVGILSRDSASPVNGQYSLFIVTSYYIPSAYWQFPEVKCWLNRFGSSPTQQGKQILAQASMPGKLVLSFTIYQSEAMTEPAQIATNSTSRYTLEAMNMARAWAGDGSWMSCTLRQKSTAVTHIVGSK